jgi:hypothetical protein
VVQRHVLYLGEINDTQELAWRRSIAVLEDGAAQPRTLSLFPGDRCEGLLADASIVRPPVPQQIRSRFRESGHFSHDGLTISRPGTEGSNPSPSSKESGANLVSSMTARRSRKRHRNSKRVWTSWRGRLARQVSQPTSNDHRSEGSKGAPPGRTIPAWRHGLTASESATCACCHPHQR